MARVKNRRRERIEIPDSVSDLELVFVTCTSKTEKEIFYWKHKIFLYSKVIMQKKNNILIYIYLLHSMLTLCSFALLWNLRCHIFAHHAPEGDWCNFVDVIGIRSHRSHCRYSIRTNRRSLHWLWNQAQNAIMNKGYFVSQLDLNTD